MSGLSNMINEFFDTKAVITEAEFYVPGRRDSGTINQKFHDARVEAVRMMLKSGMSKTEIRAGLPYKYELFPKAQDKMPSKILDNDGTKIRNTIKYDPNWHCTKCGIKTADPYCAKCEVNSEQVPPWIGLYWERDQSSGLSKGWNDYESRFFEEEGFRLLPPSEEFEEGKSVDIEEYPHGAWLVFLGSKPALHPSQTQTKGMLTSKKMNELIEEAIKGGEVELPAKSLPKKGKLYEYVVAIFNNYDWYRMDYNSKGPKFPLPERMGNNAILTIVKYLYKTAWERDLAKARELGGEEGLAMLHKMKQSKDYGNQKGGEPNPNSPTISSIKKKITAAGARGDIKAGVPTGYLNRIRCQNCDKEVNESMTVCPACASETKTPEVLAAPTMSRVSSGIKKPGPRIGRKPPGPVIGPKTVEPEVSPESEAARKPPGPKIIRRKPPESMEESITSIDVIAEFIGDNPSIDEYQQPNDPNILRPCDKCDCPIDTVTFDMCPQCGHDYSMSNPSPLPMEPEYNRSIQAGRSGYSGTGNNG